MTADLVARAVRAAGLSPRSGEIINHGESGDLVARLDGGMFLKMARLDSADRLGELNRETGALAWLAGKLKVPGIVWTGEVEGRRALVTTALPGTPVSHVAEDQASEALAETVRALAALHALPGCPFDATLPAKLALAETRLVEGLIDEADFDDERRGWTAAQALAEARRTAPADERPVPTHGDASLPNFIWSPEDGVGLIDLGRFGLADPYQDLALVLRSAARNHPGVDARALLRAHYPLAEIDEPRCDFYRLLDELF